ncbi:MAG: AbiV family abortive infection protein [Thermoplasmata archaeon]|nr:AbiV family abortive infection protein [Thermoplasmata archaeon]
MAANESPKFELDQVFQKMAAAAIQNARDLLDSAQAVASKSHFGHARSLAILGLEEGAKAYVYRGAALGVFTFDASQAGKTRLIAGEEVKLKFIVSEGALNSKHPEKHSLDAGLEFTLTMIEGVFSALPRMLRGEQTDSLEPAEVFPGFEAKLDALLERTENDNRRKNEGLYVRHIKEVVSSPSAVTQTEFAPYEARLSRRLSFLGPFVDSDLSTGSGEDLAKAFFGDSWPAIEELRKLQGATEKAGDDVSR